MPPRILSASAVIWVCGTHRPPGRHVTCDIAHLGPDGLLVCSRCGGSWSEANYPGSHLRFQPAQRPEVWP